MTNEERKQKQVELDHLRARKAKADRLGSEVIARTKDKYDGICREIARLETELAADLGGPLAELTKVIHEALGWEWPSRSVDVWTAAMSICPGVTKDIDDLERDMTAAYNQGRHGQLSELVPRYREALRRLYMEVSAPPRQSNLLDAFEEVTVNAPW